MKKIKLLGFFLVPMAALGLLAANVASAETTSGTPTNNNGVWSNARMMGPRGNSPGVTGTVTANSGNVLTVTSKGFGQNKTQTTYTVDASNAVIMKNNATSTVASIAVGDNIMARGTLTGTSLVATSIRDGIAKGMMTGKNKQTNSIIKGNGQPVVGGNVTAVSGSTLTITNVSNVTYTVDASNAVVDKTGVTSTVSNIIVGDRVVVQGTVNGTAITASSIIDQGVIPTNAASTPEKNTGFFGAIRGFFHNVFGFF